MRMKTRTMVRTTVVAILTALVALILGFAQTLTTAITASLGLTAFQALIVPGTGTPNPDIVPHYLDNVMNYYVNPGGNCVEGSGSDCPAHTGIHYYATFWPIPLPGWGGLQGQKWNVSVGQGVDHLTDAYDLIPATDGNGDPNTVTVFGYSQGATVANIFKTQHPQDASDTDDPLTNYFFIGDPQRPSGGFFERFGFLGNVPILDAQFGQPANTTNCTDGAEVRTCATDLALQYDGVADFPQWLLNPVAFANAAAGFQYIHGTYLAPDGDDAADATPYGYTPDEVQNIVDDVNLHGCTAANASYCQHVAGSDTIYITLPARTLPLYQPVLDLGSALGATDLVVPVVDLLQPATQTLIETGYNRTDYSKAQQGTLLPPSTFNPIQTGVQLVKDVPIGINNALTPGLQPLPGSCTCTVVGTDGTGPQSLAADNQTATQSVMTDNKPITRLSLFAKPGEGIATVTGATGTSGSNTNQPIKNALKDVHPVRDVVKAVSGAVSGAVNTAVGKSDATSS
jgi:hypothetical protein